ncbi:MAG: S66 peptidase family protein [Thermodesulfobacteriota bacterium]
MKPTRDRIRRPRNLSRGDTIGIAAPAGPFDRQKFDKGLDVLREMGFRIKVPDGLDRREGYLAGDDTHRAAILNRLFADKDVNAIMCARGGFGSIHLLDLLDLELIRGNPKMVVGFSDITVLLAFLCRSGRMAVFHGPMVTTLARADAETKKALLKAIDPREKLLVVPEKPLTLNPGVASGKVMGGNLASLCHLVGTPHAPRLGGCILVLEDVQEAPYKIDRMLIQMKLAGIFRGLAGLALGSFTDCGPAEDIYPVFTKVFSDMNIPMLAGFDFGHGKRNLTLPLGVTATLDADGRFLQYHRPATIQGR